MTLSEFLQALMDRAQDNPNSLAAKSKVKQSTIFRILNGETKEPRMSTMAKIARIYMVPVEAFMSDASRQETVVRLNLLRQGREFNDAQDSAMNTATPAIHPDDIVIYQYDAAGSMGHGLDLPDQPGVIQHLRVNKEWLSKNVRAYSATRNLCVVTGFGDSMQPIFNPGDPLLVDLGVTTVEFDSVYFFRVGNLGYVKRLQRIPTESGLVIRAISENKGAYDPFDITEKMDFHVIGRVLKVWRSQEF